MWTIFKVFIEFATILLLISSFVFFDQKACGILAPQPRVEPTLPALEGEVLNHWTTSEVPEALDLSWALVEQIRAEVLKEYSQNRLLRIPWSQAKLGLGAIYPNILDLAFHFEAIVGNFISLYDMCTLPNGCGCWQRNLPVGWPIALEGATTSKTDSKRQMTSQLQGELFLRVFSLRLSLSQESWLSLLVNCDSSWTFSTSL